MMFCCAEFARLNNYQRAVSYYPKSDKKNDEYMVMLHDTKIEYCPFCGTKLIVSFFGVKE